MRLASRGVIGVGGLDAWRTVLARVAERGHRMTERLELSGPVAL
jgi:hypothetical protein